MSLGFSRNWNEILILKKKKEKVVPHSYGLFLLGGALHFVFFYVMILEPIVIFFFLNWILSQVSCSWTKITSAQELWMCWRAVAYSNKVLIMVVARRTTYEHCSVKISCVCSTFLLQFISEYARKLLNSTLFSFFLVNLSLDYHVYFPFFIHMMQCKNYLTQN